MNQDAALRRCGGANLLMDGSEEDADVALRDAFLTTEVDDLVGESIPLQQQVLVFKNIVAHLRKILFFDPLTHLPGWALFKRQLASAFEEARQAGCSFAVFFLDLDHFKNINHSFGHDVGDRLLGLFAQRVSAVLEAGDILSRKGGDRFFLLMPRVQSDGEAEAVAVRVMSLLREPFEIAGQEVFLTISIGIALYPQQGGDVVALLQNADAAMNKAKREGRNAYRFFCNELHAKATRYLQIENLLHKALERGEFYVCYQPQFRFSSSNGVGPSGLIYERIVGNMIGCEALLRWESRELGPVAPSEFVPIAEATGMIEAIGEWVVKTACVQNKKWQEAGYKPFRVAINLSPRQLYNPHFEDMVCRQLRQAGLDACWLELEVTENCLMLDIEAAAHTLNRLRNRGIKISVDDFGTGYSSLSYLKKLPIDCLKIDRSFVQDLERCPDSTAIVQAIIDMAKQLNLGVIAEGVETVEQAAFLSRNGCPDLQGYFFSRPLAADRFAESLAHGMQPQAQCWDADASYFWSVSP